MNELEDTHVSEKMETYFATNNNSFQPNYFPILAVEPLTPLFQYPIRRLVRSRKVSKPWDLYPELSDHFEIWQVPWQHYCWCGSQISKWCKHFNTRSHAYEALRDILISDFIGYGNRAHLFAFQLPVPLQYGGMISNANTYVCLFKQVSRIKVMRVQEKVMGVQDDRTHTQSWVNRLGECLHHFTFI